MGSSNNSRVVYLQLIYKDCNGVQLVILALIVHGRYNSYAVVRLRSGWPSEGLVHMQIEYRAFVAAQRFSGRTYWLRGGRGARGLL